MLTIRLSQTGKKHARQYRIVVAEKRSKRDGAVTATIGHYNPKTKKIQIDRKEYTNWRQKGAQPTLIIRKLVEKN